MFPSPKALVGILCWLLSLSQNALASPSPPLAGRQSVGRTVEQVLPGTDQAFGLRGSATGMADAAVVYLDRGSRAKWLEVDLYASSRGQLGQLVASGVRSRPAARAWNRVPLGRLPIVRGVRYWLAVTTGSRGSVSLRTSANNRTGRCAVHVLQQLSPNVLDLGATRLIEMTNCALSAYVTGQPVLEPVPEVTAPPSISGLAVQGQVLSTSNGSWANSPTSFAYRWEVCNGSRAGCAPIAGATGPAYKLSASDVGSTIVASVTAPNAAGSTAASSAPTPVVAGTRSSTSTPPAAAGAPVMDTTLLNNYEVRDVVQASAPPTSGCSGGSTCTYTFQFQDCIGVTGTAGTGCVDIGNAPQCTATSATCSYTLAPGDVGSFIVSLTTALTAAGTSSTTVTPAAGPVVASRVGVFCNIPAAYTDLASGPHLCGWPDSTNVGYATAPGYPGNLTVASPGSATCPSTPQSNHTYSFCDYVGGLTLSSNLTNVTFYGDKFESNAVNNENVGCYGCSGLTNITFNYDTFQPEQAAPPVACSASYQYGIYNEHGEIRQLTVTHSNFWGFGNAIDTEGSTQGAPQVFAYNWIHDAASSGPPCNYHTDGIGMLNGGSEAYAVVDHNTIEFTGNTNLIAWQNGSYSHDQNTNNLLSGDNEGYAGGRCTSGCTPPSYIQTTGNTYSTVLPVPAGTSPIDSATSYWTAPGSTWNHNYWAVPPGASWGTPGYNGYYWLPATNSSAPQDCGFVSPTDYPVGSPLC